ncbi:hypothetical protein FA13DRAFT_1731172 [Coprinellus micaceus]|uniref:Uncharacterized protein n=1 Tax=Coprinellus micaceus TaxID=71717 RepID=A0A4Y7TES6_COPMI|nr:hypothetical protein FA13DRAFT_1731172 [Coprinellus micaceus]
MDTIILALDRWGDEVSSATTSLSPLLRTVCSNLTFSERNILSCFLCALYPIISVGILHQAATAQLKKAGVSNTVPIACDVLLFYALAAYPGAVLLFSSAFIPWALALRIAPTVSGEAFCQAIACSVDLTWLEDIHLGAVGTRISFGLRPTARPMEVPSRCSSTIAKPSRQVHIQEAVVNERRVQRSLGDEDWILVWNSPGE